MQRRRWVWGVVLAVCTGLGLAYAQDSNAQDSNAAAAVSITIDGKAVGGVTRSEGLAIEGLTDDAKQKRAMATRAPLALTLDANVTEPLFVWLAKSVSAGGDLRSTLVVGGQKKSVTFKDALITEVTLPTLDASSKAPATFAVRISPESLRFHKQAAAPNDSVAVESKQWLSSNFDVGGLPTGKVLKVESITIKQGAAPSKPKVPGKLEFPNLRLTIGHANTAAWKKWLASKSAKSLRLTLTDTTGDPWARFDLGGVELTSLKPSGKHQIATLSIGRATLTR
jgi:hypothetical protein